MSTTLIDEESGLGFYLTRFYGGAVRGVCYQISQMNGIYVTLTVAATIIQWLGSPVGQSFVRDVLDHFEVAGQR